MNEIKPPTVEDAPEPRTGGESGVAVCYAAPSEIGFRLKWLRNRLKMSLRELEAKTGVSPATISRAENGSAMDMSLGAFLSLCQALETPVSDIIGAA